MDTEKIKIEANIKANRKKVWEYWTKAEHIEKWNFASDDWHCPKAVNDLKPGGKYFARMEAKDGSMGFDFIAIYDEVSDLSKIKYTIDDGRGVITKFEEVNDSTRVTTIFEAEKTNTVEMQRMGWQAILDNFKKYVENT